MLQRSHAAALVVAAFVTLVPPMHAAMAGARAQAPAAVPPVHRLRSSRLCRPSWTGLRLDALARGISATTVDRALTDLEPSPTVIERDQTQAEFVLSVDDYVARRLTRPFVRTARQNATKHIARCSTSVEREIRRARRAIIVAIWGLESNFGRFSGVRPTIQALATLAWEGRRGAFFRGELMDALEIVDRGYIGLEQLRGSWAGAMGQTQFMPSSYLQWAEDFDDDGDRDIWRSHHDVFASIANYLKQHGWSPGRDLGARGAAAGSGHCRAPREEVGMRVEGCRAEREMTQRLPLAALAGARRAHGRAEGRCRGRRSKRRSSHTGKRAFLVYGNYEALLEYNCAHSYALAVALLSDLHRRSVTVLRSTAPRRSP